MRGIFWFKTLWITEVKYKFSGTLFNSLPRMNWTAPWEGSVFRAEKRNEHASTFLPRSPDRVWKNGGISNILLPKNKMFPLIPWKKQAICLQKLQAVVIILSFLNFLEEYLIVKRTLRTSISLRCTGNVYALVRFFSDAFTKCVHIRKFLDI